MSNEGFFDLGLLDVADRPANDPDVKIRFFRIADPTRTIVHATNLTFPPKRRFTLPAFPQAVNLVCEVTASRFRQRRSDVFTLTDGETITRNLTLFRRPEKWAAEFVLWNQLANHFAPLQKLLEDSPKIKVRGGKTHDKFTETAYDNLSDKTTVLAKASLLNLYTKLTVIKEPTGGNEPWVSFVKRIIEIGRERLIAVVDPRMGQIVRHIKNNIAHFKDYKDSSAQNHFDNFPHAYQVQKSKMFSIKSQDEIGNVQLTMAPGKDTDGNEILLLDADIDENGLLLKHLADLFKHKFTGGTHPFDIHEYLVLAHRERPLGYKLI